MRFILYLCVQTARMNRYHVIVPLLVLVAACSTPEREPNVTVAGQFTAYGGEWVLLEELEPLKIVRLDSCMAGEDGSFSFDLQVPDAGFFVLRSGDENTILLVEQGEHVVLRSASGHFDRSLEVAGSPGTLHLLDFKRFMDHQRRRIDS